MGRKPDAPEDQAAKGFPGKRKSKTERQIEAANQRAAMLASAPAAAPDAFAPPTFLDDPALADALWIWERYVPRLRERGHFDELDRLTFATYCVYQAEFFQAHRNIIEKGYWFERKSSAGGTRPWVNPSVAWRDTAARFVMDLSRKFALTPLDRSELERRHSMMDDGPLFRRSSGDDPEPTRDQASEVAGPAEDEPLGILNRLDSAPPGQRPN